MIVMYVDDDPDDRQIFCEAIKSIIEHCQCPLAKDGLDALTYLRSHELPDIIFMDINMPLMDGKTCLREIRANRETAHLPVVIFTTSNDLKERWECKQLGANDFLLKPVSYVEMKELLRSILHASKLV